MKINPKTGKRITKPRIEIDLKQVEGHAARGMTQEQIAAALGIHVSTLEERKRESKEFQEAIKRGQAKGIGVVTNCLFEQVKRGIPSSTIFF